MQDNENLDAQPVVVTQKVYTLANFFSFSRILAAPLIIWVHHAFDGVSVLFTLLVVYAIASDYLDGWAARGKNEISELGKVLDPVADKLLAGLLFLYAAWLGLIPVWFVALCIGRDLIIMGGSVYIKTTRGKVSMSVMSGKVFVNFLALYWLAVMYFPSEKTIIQYLLILSLLLLITSFIDYAVRFIKILRGASFN